GDWEGWLAFFLRGIIEVSRESTDVARRILALREEHRTAITAQLGRAAGNGHKVLEYLYRHPIISVADVQTLTATTYAAANNLVSRLEEIGLVVETTGFRRNRRFR